MGIEEKFERLNPAAQDIVMAFVDFLISRGEERSREDEKESLFTTPEPASVFPGEEQPVPKERTGSGIIFAEERKIVETDDAIDFADINTRFSREETKEENPSPVRQRKTFDWL